MRTISIRLDDHTDALLAAHCESHGVTQTDAIKAALEQLAQTHRPTPAELARQFGLIGVFRSGDPELGGRHSERVKQVLRDEAERRSEPASRAGARPAVRRKRQT